MARLGEEASQEAGHAHLVGDDVLARALHTGHSQPPACERSNVRNPGDGAERQDRWRKRVDLPS